MVQQYHVPMLAIPYSVWRLGPVSVDVFEELSDGPVLLSDFIALEINGQGIRVTPKQEFNDDEFSEAELKVMKQVMEKYGWMNSEQLISETHKEGSLWYETAKEHGLLEDFDQNRANSSSTVIDMARFLSPSDREYYEETLEIRESANQMRMAHERGKALGLSKERIYEMIKEAGDAIDLETFRADLHQMIEEVYAEP